jgi:lipopolysaccharide assembly protein A
MMFRYLRYLILAALGLGLMIMSLANRSPVVIKAMPDDLAAFLGVNWQIELPLFLVIFGGMVAGVLVGFVWEWAREHKHRVVASTKTREVSKLERELATMRDATSVPADDVIALLDRPKAK